MGALEVTILLILLVILACGLFLASASRRRQAGIARRHQHVGTEIEVDGGLINVVELGSQRRGPCLVLLHGAGANLEDLRVSVGERLARDRRVLLIDRPGHGWSDDLIGEGSHSPESQAIALSQVFAAHGVENPILIGHDVGGTVALAYALSYPEDVAGLVVISPLSHAHGVSTTLGQRLVLLPHIGPILAWLLVPVLGRWTQMRHLARAFAPQTVPADYYDAVAAELALKPRNYISAATERAALGEFLEEQSQYYGEVTVPVAVIAGEDDRIANTEEHAAKLAHSLNGARWVVLNEVGHMPHHVSPNVILFEINRLADRLWSGMVDK